MKRLRTDRLDLFQLHSPAAAVVERGDWATALDALRAEGKIRWYGVSCDDAATAQAALRFPGVSSLQLPLSMLEHAIADAVLPLAREGGVAVIARECLANGLLAKDLAQLDLAGYCKSPEEQALRRRQIASAQELAQAHGASLPRLALQYASGLPGVTVALVGLRTHQQLASTLSLLAQPALPADALRRAGVI